MESSRVVGLASAVFWHLAVALSIFTFSAAILGFPGLREPAGNEVFLVGCLAVYLAGLGALHFLQGRLRLAPAWRTLWVSATGLGAVYLVLLLFDFRYSRLLLIAGSVVVTAGLVGWRVLSTRGRAVGAALAIVAGVSGVGRSPPADARAFAVDLAGSFDDGLPSAPALLSEPAVAALEDLVADRVRTPPPERIWASSGATDP